MAKLRVDREKCIKAGECYYNHPTLLKLSESGYPDILIEDITTDNDRQEALEAIEICPAQAISLGD